MISLYDQLGSWFNSSLMCWWICVFS